MPLPLLAIGAGLAAGAAKHYLVDEPKQTRQAKARAEQIRVSPWLKHAPDIQVSDPSLFGSLLQGAALGSMAGPGLGLGGTSGTTGTGSTTAAAKGATTGTSSGALSAGAKAAEAAKAAGAAAPASAGAAGAVGAGAGAVVKKANPWLAFGKGLQQAAGYGK